MVTKSCWYSRETAEYQLRLFRAINLFRASLCISERRYCQYTADVQKFDA